MKMHKRWSWLAVLLGSLMLLSVPALPTGAQQLQTTVTVESADLPQGAEATMRVTVEGAPGAGVVSFQGTLSFDENVIQVLRVEFPPQCPVRAFNIEAGLVRFAATKCPGAEGEGIREGELFRLIIRAVGPPGSTTTLSPTFSLFLDRDFQSIEHRVVPGTIRIISAENQLPIADFEFVPRIPSTRDTIQFIDLSRDPDGRIVEWLWDFGDGTTANVQTPSHKYAQAGLYNVMLTVTDNRGGTGSTTKRLFVFQAPPPDAALVICFPNPARIQARCAYFLPEGTTRATFLAFDLVGRPVFTWPLDVTGREFVWNLKDNQGNDLPNGPYFYLVQAQTPAGLISSRVEVLVIQR